MKVVLTQAYRISFPAGSVLSVSDDYAETLKALGVAKIQAEPVKQENAPAKPAAKKTPAKRTPKKG